MAIDSIRNSSKAVASQIVYDGTAEFPQSQMQGIFVGVVKQQVFSTRNGHLKVYIPDFGGDPDLASSWKDVIYASPFLGKTTGNYPDTEESTGADNTFTNAGQSYGMFMVPPDLGNEVLCFFSPSRFEGYWFACVNSNRTRQMTPAIGSVKLSSVQPESIPEYLRPYIDSSWNYPVSETVINLPESESNTDPSLMLKPLHESLTLQYYIQGLISDNKRGPISSSSQRDPISTVFGFSSPGRPYGDQDPAVNAELRNQIKSGTVNPADLIVKNRIQGHSIIMDDGDFDRNNQMIRLRTSAGHQIMMNDSDGFIYISNSLGSAWVELTQEGDILVYGLNDFAVRTSGNIMMNSDRNINFDAKGSINLKSENSIKFESQLVQARAETGLNLFGKVAQLRGASQTAVMSGGPMMIRASGAIMVNGSKIALNGEGGGGGVAPPQSLPKYYVADADFNGLVWSSQPNSYTSINYKVPTHEPYVRGNIAAEVEQQIEIFNAPTQDIDGNYIEPPVNIPSVGPEASEDVILTDSAPTEAFISQIPSPNSVGVLTVTDLTALNAQIGHTTSQGDYTSLNTETNQVGKYGLKVDDLISSGYLKEGTPNDISALQNPNNWRGQDAINDLDGFLSASSVQERVQYDKTRKIYTELEADGLITQTTTPQQAAGLINASISTSTQDVSKWYTKGILPEGDNSKLVQAYKQGIYSNTQTPVLVASNQSRVI